ncbi:MAG: NTP transferase domain-containing protein, partial [Acidobacteria bacterium]|nr:NTP transferase domain-containing protein [Acidobacteriota bacterium]
MAEPLRAYAVILAGGRGTRFWPLSRQRHPKQFLRLVSSQSLLEQTFWRLRRIFPRNRILVVTDREQARLVRRQLRSLPARNLLLEPVGRNTAAAIALAAAHIRRQEAHDALLGVFPADHVIRAEARFRRLARAALATAASGECAVVLGITPSEPNTGYGYIERGAFWKRTGGVAVYRARRFTEKPDLATARRYLRSRRYYWNSGMFFWKLSTFERLLRRFLPATAQAMQNLGPIIGTRAYGRTLARLYPKLPQISVDYALLERAPDV